MNQVGAWLATWAQQTLAILVGGVIAVGWGRGITEWVGKTVEDRRWQSIAYIDVPRDGDSEAYYYVGPSRLSERPPVQDGNYHTYRKVSDPYFRYEFKPGRLIWSREKLYSSMMTALRTQDDGHILKRHPLRPSQNSWQPGKPLGQFQLLEATKP